MPAPYPGQRWKHGWIPLTPGAVIQKNHGKRPGPKSKLGRVMASVSESSPSRRPTGGRSASTGPSRPSRSPSRSRSGGGGGASREMDSAIRNRAARRRSRPVTTGTPARTATPPADSSAPAIPADAPAPARQVADAARRAGWRVAYRRNDDYGTPRHHLAVRGPEGETYQMTWDGNRRVRFGDDPPIRDVIAAINNPEGSENAAERSRVRRERDYAEFQRRQSEERRRRADRTTQQRMAEARERERRAAAEAARREEERARAEAARRDEERRREIDRFERAERDRAERARRAQERIEREREEARRREEEERRRIERNQKRAAELNSQAARAYRAGNYKKALELLAKASELDPQRAGEFAMREGMVREAMRRRG